MNLAKPTRINDLKLRARIKEGRCIVCGARGCDPDHIKTRGSGGDDIPTNIVPQCRRHHSDRHALGWVRFLEKYPSARLALEAKGWEIVEILGRKKLMRTE